MKKWWSREYDVVDILRNHNYSDYKTYVLNSYMGAELDFDKNMKKIMESIKHRNTSQFYSQLGRRFFSPYIIRDVSGMVCID